MPPNSMCGDDSNLNQLPIIQRILSTSQLLSFGEAPCYCQIAHTFSAVSNGPIRTKSGRVFR